MDTLVSEQPVVTPSQSTPEPSPAPATTAPETTPTSTTTAAPAAKPAETAAVVTGEQKPEYKSGGDIQEHLKSVLKYNEAHPEKTGEVRPEVKVEPEVKSEPVIEKTADEKAAEAQAREEAEKAKTAEANPYDKSGPLPAEKLAAALSEDKALSDALAGKTIKLDDGREINLKDAIFESSRMAAQAAPMLELFPTLEAAQEADQGAKVFFDLDTKFPAIKDTQSLDSFMMETLVPLSYLRDDKGELIPNPELPGTYKTDGSVDRFVGLLGDVEMGQIEHIAGLISKNENTKEYGEDLIGAVKFINDFRKAGYRMPGTPSGEKPVIPAEVQQELEQLRADKRQVTEQKTAQDKAAFDSFEQKILDGTMAKIKPHMESVLNLTSLSDYEKTTVAEKVWKDLQDTIALNKTWERGRDQMKSHGELSDAVQQRRVAHNFSYMNQILNGILDKRLQEAGTKRFQANQERDKKIATQIEQSKMEPKTGATVATPQNATLSGDDLHKKALEQARTKNGGREPNAQQVLAETLALKRILQQSA